MLTTFIFFALGGSGVNAQQVILSGSDLWSTPGGGQTTHSFADDPIPAGFFGEGSEPFDGTVVFTGLPFQDNPGLMPQGTNLLGTADTIVRRLEDMSLDRTGDTATTPIEIIALSLVSVEPINVTFDGEEMPFHVEVQLPFGAAQPQGEMSINHDIFEGGTFDAVLPVNANLFFVNASTGQFVGSRSTEIELTTRDQPWLFSPFFRDGTELVKITDPLQLGPGGNVNVPPTSPNFQVGVTNNPATGLSKCVLAIEEAERTRHGVLPAHHMAGPDTDGDGINNSCDNCPMTPNPLQEDANKDCTGDACRYMSNCLYFLSHSTVTRAWARNVPACRAYY